MPTTSQPPQPNNGLQVNSDNTFDVKPSDTTLAVDAGGVRVDTVPAPNVTDINPNVGAMNLAGWV